MEGVKYKVSLEETLLKAAQDKKRSQNCNRAGNVSIRDDQIQS